NHSDDLIAKPTFVVLTKADIVDNERVVAISKEFKSAGLDTVVSDLSNHDSLVEILNKTIEYLHKAAKSQETADTQSVDASVKVYTVDNLKHVFKLRRPIISD